MTNAISHDGQPKVSAYIDRYQIYGEQYNRKYPADPRREAQMLKGLLSVYGLEKRMVAILHEKDKEAITAYDNEGYEIHTMNGNRPIALPHLVSEETKHTPPERMVVVSSDPMFTDLCTHAVKQGSHVLVWSPTEDLPDELMDSRFERRYLSNLLPPAVVRAPIAMVWLDIENLLITLKNKGIMPDIKNFVSAIRAETKDLGRVTQLIAYGDFTLLSETIGCDVQRQLEQMGVRTRYQINMYGKNSADMEIASDIHSFLEDASDVETIVIGTGDRDFRPVVDAAHAKGKRVIVLAFQEGISHLLHHAVDEVRYLDAYFVNQLPLQTPITPENEWVPQLMQFAHFLDQHKWHWAYRDRLDHIATPEELERMVHADMLVPGCSNHSPTLRLNMANPLVRATRYMAWWITGRLNFLIREQGMPYVDSHFLANGMRKDEKCQKLGIGQTRLQAEAWLRKAMEAGLVTRRLQRHPDTPEKIIKTWWPN